MEGKAALLPSCGDGALPTPLYLCSGESLVLHLYIRKGGLLCTGSAGPRPPGSASLARHVQPRASALQPWTAMSISQ